MQKIVRNTIAIIPARGGSKDSKQKYKIIFWNANFRQDNFET